MQITSLTTPHADFLENIINFETKVVDSQE